MRKSRVGVLQERDQDEPVVNPEVWHQIGPEDVQETEGLDGEGDTCEPDDNTNIGPDDGSVLMGSK